MTEKQTSSSKSFISGKAVVIVLSIVILVLGIASMFFYVQYQKIKKNPNIVAKQETEVLVEQIGKLIELPKDETPTVATVTDRDKLKDQPFFANAANGDKILIFTKAKKAIVFRPKEGRLINVGPIAIDQKPQVAVAIVSAGGDSAAAEKSVTDSLGTNVTIVSKTTAKNSRAIKSTLVVDVSGQNADAAAQIASALGGTVGALPAGETAPEGASIVLYVK